METFQKRFKPFACFTGLKVFQCVSFGVFCNNCVLLIIFSFSPNTGGLHGLMWWMNSTSKMFQGCVCARLPAVCFTHLCAILLQEETSVCSWCKSNLTFEHQKSLWKHGHGKPEGLMDALWRHVRNVRLWKSLSALLSKPEPPPFNQVKLDKFWVLGVWCL